jgi:6-phosphogluconolactonase/glucosamine-6-phosphate isomerase/deaminase
LLKYNQNGSQSELILFVVSGKEKAEALRECIVGDYDPIQYPAQFIFHNYTNDIYILCDKVAGKYIA